MKTGGLIRLETDAPEDKGTHIASFTAKREAEADFVYEACNAFDRLTSERNELLACLKELWASVAGGEKSCGHAFTCCCAGDKTKNLLKRLEAK